MFYVFFNKLAFIKIDRNFIKIKLLNKEFLFSFSEELYIFLHYMYKKNKISLKIFRTLKERLNIPDKIVEELSNNSLIDIQYVNSWLESKSFHDFLEEEKKEKAKYRTLKYLKYIYSSWRTFRISHILRKDLKYMKKVLKINWEMSMKKFSIEDLFFLRSIRFLKENNEEFKWFFDTDINKILQITLLIFKAFFKRSREYNRYWSWGHFYLIFPMIVCKEWIYIYEKREDSFYFIFDRNIFKDLICKWILSKSIDLEKYNYIIYLIAYPKFYFWKYWNLGYKLLLLECWEISFLYRMFFNLFDIAHVEFQGYDEEFLKENLIDFVFKRKEEVVLLHSILAK